MPGQLVAFLGAIRTGPHTRHGDVEHRTEEQEQREREQAAIHGDILRRRLAPPAAFGAACGHIAAEIVAALDAVAALASDNPARGERTTRRHQRQEHDEFVQAASHDGTIRSCGSGSCRLRPRPALRAGGATNGSIAAVRRRSTLVV